MVMEMVESIYRQEKEEGLSRDVIRKHLEVEIP